MTRIAIAAIRVYQLCVSPWLVSTCVFSPSCSCFAVEAYSRHGFWKGTRLTLARLGRCWPWSSGGFDPVPRAE